MTIGVDEIASRLRAGQLIADDDFDAWLPAPLRQPSRRYWTHVGVAVRVASWLRSRGVCSVLDVGSGAGKFCVVGALSTGLSFTGVEQRGHLFDAARSLAARFGVSDRARFVHGDFDTVDCQRFDALYFYNPFGENVAPRASQLDETVELGRARFNRDIATAQAVLSRMPVGAYLVTYNGYGGRVPDNFDLLQAKVAGLSLLRLWRKTREQDTGGYWLELDESTPFRVAGVLQLVDRPASGE